jgi:AraC-like DNA-binding protein
MQFSFLQLITTIILFQLLLLIVFLLASKKGKRLSNFLLAGFFFLLFINLVDGVLAFTGFFQRHAAFAHMEDGFVFLIGPVLYFYTLSLIYQDFGFERRHLFHLIPFIVFTTVYLVFYHTRSDEYQQMVQASIVSHNLPPGFYFSIVLIYAHIGTYVALSVHAIRKYRAKIREEYSNIGKINLDWLIFMLYSVTLVLFVSLLYTVLPAVGLSDYFDLVFLSTFIFLFVFVIGVVWKGLRQPEIFAGITTEEDVVKKYTLAMNPDDRETIRRKLIELMDHEKVYLDADLTLDVLAKQISSQGKKVSQVINDAFRQNFFDFVNGYRINEAKRIFQNNSDSKLTVLEVMYASGFNSKSSFNTVFKTKVGMTPSAFKAACLKK